MVDERERGRESGRTSEEGSEGHEGETVQRMTKFGVKIENSRLLL